MSIYILIDGDDIGNKVAKSYIENNEKKLLETIQELNCILSKIYEHLKTLEFEIIFCAADGIVGKGSNIDVDRFAYYLGSIGEPNYTFSAGIGNDLQSSFFSLKYAKAIGKNKVVLCEDGKQFRVIDGSLSTIACHERPSPVG
jgi:hypothetical protein